MAVPAAEPAPGRSIAPENLLWLGALALLLVFLALEPLLSFFLFGSDTGEYYRLTSVVVSTGHIPLGTAYFGWGFAYQDFPGIYLLAGSVAASGGTDVLTALSTTIPIVAVLSVIPLFLVFRRIFPNDTVALFGAGLATIVMPRLFSIAHPAPLALGDFFVVALLWMFVEGRRDARWYLPLSVTGAALIITHHLSSYFFLVSSLGGLLLLELWRPGLWSRRYPLRELLFLGGFLTGLLAYWFGYAESFGPVLAQGVPYLSRVSFALFEGAGILGLLAAAFVIRWRRTRPAPSRAWVRLPTDRSVLRDAAIILGAVFVGIGVLLFAHLPGTTQTVAPGALLWFSPVLIVGALAAGIRKLVTFSRLGPLAVAWLGALGLSAFVALLTSNSVISASRHVEYIFVPLGLLVAISVGRWIAVAGERRGRQAILAGGIAVIMLLTANAAIVYPPPSDFGGFQEGLTVGDSSLWMWVGIAIPTSAVIASDHRLSSMVFGFDGNRATWDSTPALFTGSNRSAALAELVASFAPHGTPRSVNVVLIDGTMYGGVALDPSAPALPLTPSATGWLASPPFVLLYQNGPMTAYWVDSSLA